MKNIHLLLTGNVTKLYKNLLTNKLFILENSFMDVSECNREYQNIYITSDEEIKIGDYRYNTLHPNEGVFKVENQEDLDYVLKRKQYKKIIITTDLDLIKDNVEAINNEFLEFFIKNTSCENVEIEKFNNQCKGECGICDNTCANWYKIIIPKEEEILLQSSIDGEAIWGTPANKCDKLPSQILQEHEEMKQHLIDLLSGEKLSLMAKTFTEQLLTKINK